MKVKDIEKRIREGRDPYFDYGHFDKSNMSDYTLMSTTISDMVELYDINEEEAVNLVTLLTH